MNAIDLASLLCSRLCHDLLSPVGALNNGLELMADELVVIGRGRLLAAGTVESFVSGFTHTSTLVSSPAIDDLLRAVMVAAAAAFDVHVRTRGSSCSSSPTTAPGYGAARNGP